MSAKKLNTVERKVGAASVKPAQRKARRASKVGYKSVTPSKPAKLSSVMAAVDDVAAREASTMDAEAETLVSNPIYACEAADAVKGNAWSQTVASFAQAIRLANIPENEALETATEHAKACEDDYREREPGRALTSIWSGYKSTILRGMKQNIMPWDSEGEPIPQSQVATATKDASAEAEGSEPITPAQAKACGLRNEIIKLHSDDTLDPEELFRLMTDTCKWAVRNLDVKPPRKAK